MKEYGFVSILESYAGLPYPWALTALMHHQQNPAYSGSASMLGTTPNTVISHTTLQDFLPSTTAGF